MIIRLENNLIISKGIRTLLVVFLFCNVLCCNNINHRIPSPENGKLNSDTFSEKNFNFETYKINLDSLKKVILTQYVKGSEFNTILRIDTFEVSPTFNKEKYFTDHDFWSFYIYNPYKDSVSNIFNYDYELKLINLPKVKIRYSNILIKQEKIYGGFNFYIDSFTYNNKRVKNIFGSNILGIW